MLQMSQDVLSNKFLFTLDGSIALKLQHESWPKALRINCAESARALVYSCELLDVMNDV